MRADEVLSFLFANSGMSKYRLSQELGHHRNWASNQLARISNPTINTVTEVANLMGWKVAFIDDDGRVLGTIEPPLRSAAEEDD